MDHVEVARALGLDPSRLRRGDLAVHSPIDGELVARLSRSTAGDIGDMIGNGLQAFSDWRRIPAPRRGEFVRRLGLELRAHKDALAAMVSTECGKILEEARGEVQEMIDVCDFAVGLSRQLYGLTMPSERPGHSMREQWHPMGVCAVITAFNFPVAVWAWNAALALICGNPVIWKPSEKTPLSALAVQRMVGRVAAAFADAPVSLCQVAIGGADAADALVRSRDVAIVSATGSTAMGRAVAPAVAERFGRCILELGGNNAMIVTPSADLDMALRAIVFAAVGTAGQRCTTLRRLLVHESVHDDLVQRLATAYTSLTIGNPVEDGVLVGPLVDEAAYDSMQQALAVARQEGGRVLGGERVLHDRFPRAFYVRPAIVQMPRQTELVQRETFAPVLFVMRYSSFDDALAMHNDVPQGLSSSVFTGDVREAEYFLSAEGSDCGIANVNVGPSGAEIGGAFGGEKDTGGGRESGSDAWKAYMRRQTATINYSHALPLAQGIDFGV